MTPCLLAPSGFGHNEPFWLAGRPDDPQRARLQAILAYPSRGAVCIGGGEIPPAEGTIVLFEADAFTHAGRLANAGIAPERMRYLPLLENYPWAYWDLWGWFEGRPDLHADLTTFEAFRHAADTSHYLGDQAGSARCWNDLVTRFSYWGAYRDRFAGVEAQVAMVHDGLADDASRRLYDLVYRSDPGALWSHFLTSIFGVFDYLEHGRPEPGETILNLGIFSGHELPAFLTLIGEDGLVYDVDPIGHDLLSDYTRTVLGTRPGRVHEVRLAAGSRNGIGYFHRNVDGQMSVVAPNHPGAEAFKIQPLDDYVEAAGIGSIDFVKIDVEGMEEGALAGLKRTLKRDRPTLSLAIYHYAEHFWGLPLMLMRELVDYDFYIDHFSPQRWETVLTAIPRERAKTAGFDDIVGLNKYCPISPSNAA